MFGVVNILHQFTCLPVTQLQCRNKSVNKSSGHPRLRCCVKKKGKKSWLLKQHVPITAAPLQTGTLYLNSDDSRPKPPACIISSCLWSNPREVVFFWLTRIAFPSRHHVSVARQNELQSASALNKIWQTETMRNHKLPSLNNKYRIRETGA